MPLLQKGRKELGQQVEQEGCKGGGETEMANYSERLVIPAFLGEVASGPACDEARTQQNKD